MADANCSWVRAIERDVIDGSLSVPVLDHQQLVQLARPMWDQSSGSGPESRWHPTPVTPSTRGSLRSNCLGQIVSVHGRYGWIQPLQPINHDTVDAHEGHIYLNLNDVRPGTSLQPEMLVEFYIYADRQGLGAEDCRAAGEPATAPRPWQPKSWQKPWQERSWQRGSESSSWHSSRQHWQQQACEAPVQAGQRFESATWEQHALGQSGGPWQAEGDGACRAACLKTWLDAVDDDADSTSAGGSSQAGDDASAGDEALRVNPTCIIPTMASLNLLPPPGLDPPSP